MRTAFRIFATLLSCLLLSACRGDKEDDSFREDFSVTEDLGISLSQYAADDKSGRSVTDQSAESKDLAASISQQVVRDAHVIKTSRYIGKNNQFTVFVCMEYGTDKDALVKGIEDRVKENISADDRVTLEKRHNEFRDKVYGKLKNQ